MEQRQLSLSSNVVIGICATALVLIVLFIFDPARHGFYPICLFHRTTGLLCPGCGGLRATHQLLHGHIREAVRLNALFVLMLLPAAAFLTARWVVLRLQGRNTELKSGLRWVWVGAAVTIAFGIGRNFL